MVNEILKYTLAMAAGAGMKGRFEIKVVKVTDSSSGDVADIAISPWKSEQGKVRIFLYKKKAGITIFTSSGAGIEFAEKVRDEILDHPEVFSCIIESN